MGIFREIPPTAGFPIPLTDFFTALWTKSDALEEDFRRYLGVPFARVTNSGTAALYIILETLKGLSPKRTVIIPSFVCPLVPLAAARAGLKIEVCDIQKDNFDFDYPAFEKICNDTKDILAVVGVHLAGIPIDLHRFTALCLRYGIFSIEDCAQSLGALYKGKKTGTLGDFSFFSLCRGKGLTIYEGGVLVTKRKEFVPAIEEKLRLLKPAIFPEFLKILELFGYSIFYRPWFFWWVYRLPQIFWMMRGKELRAQAEEYSVDFPLYAVSGWRKRAGHAGFRRLDKEISGQRERANLLRQNIGPISGLRVIEGGGEDAPTYPYLSLILQDAGKISRLKKPVSGLGVSQVYARAITDYEYLRDILPQRDCPNARKLAQHSITLSASKFLNKRELSRIIELFKRV